ncbi:penicillin acylase family protein [bacterium]|jgi:acyl-homoserine-lactone acylase|nr:penicillin acylase family protein [bacterium]
MRLSIALSTTLLIWSASAQAQSASEELSAEKLASQVTIYRDSFGVPHIDAATDAAGLFASMYAQCEDYFWQVEDNYILSTGRYSEVHGKNGVASDLLNRAFEIVPTSQRDFETQSEMAKKMCRATAEGINHFLATHPEVKPRLITHFEPWHVLALNRHLSMEQLYRFAHIDGSMPRLYKEMDAARGSNAFALAPSKTKSGYATLLINPHQPYFDFGQFYEVHVRSAEDGGFNYTGGTFFGNPMPILGWNEYLGWAMTTNRPDVADAWQVKFEDPKNPLAYRYGNEWRQATEWTEVIKVKVGDSIENRNYTFRKTHHGPCMKKINENTWLAAKISKLYDGFFPIQLMAMARSRSIPDFKKALSIRDFQYQHLTLADKEGNIAYIYYGAIPRRDPKFDWNHFLDGNDPAQEWQGLHEIAELPQIYNPVGGYLQNCNSSPHTTTDDANPFIEDFPNYMCEDKYVDERRSKMARQLLRQVEKASYEEIVKLAFDTTMHWPKSQIPMYRSRWAELRERDSKLADEVKPFLDHFEGWDFRVTADSTQAPLAHAWYEEMYGLGSPARDLEPAYVDDFDSRYKALVKAAKKLQGIYGNWQVKWGDIYRIQRHTEVVGFVRAPFNDRKESFPLLAVPGPLGSIFTCHYLPAINLGPLRNTKKRYGIVGNSFMAVVEFGPKIRGGSLLQFGENADPDSPNHVDQAKLLSEQKLKPALFYWDDVMKEAKRSYHPGQPAAIRTSANP